MSYLQKKLEEHRDSNETSLSTYTGGDVHYVEGKIVGMNLALEYLADSTCKNCRHSEQYENKNGWMMCHGIQYDGGDVEGAMIDGDVGWMFVKPDFGCYGFEAKERE